MNRVRATAALACLWIVGCASHPARVQLPELSAAQVAAAEAGQVARENTLAALPRWTLVGRVAVSRGREGGSGRLEWRQDGDRFEVALSAPVTRQGWRLEGDASGARLDGLEGGTREGPDATALLLEATRLDVPVAALASWARGARAETARFGPARIMFGADGRPSRLSQAGWTIDYQAWTAAGSLALPQRLNAVRDDARLRLVVDSWGGPPAP